MTSLLDNIKDNAELLEQMSKVMVTKTVKKGTLLQKKYDDNSKVYFVKKGCLRSYTIDDKEKEHIFMFAPEGWIISDIESQVNNAPTELYIDAIEDSEIEIMPRGNADELFFAKEMVDNIGISRLMKRISVLQRRVIMLMSATALQRYNDFLEMYPNIVQRVPQKMIASYLGITPEALSKIRGQLAKPKK